MLTSQAELYRKAAEQTDEIHSLLHEIGEAADRLRSADRINYGHIGDLNRIREELDNILQWNIGTE